MNLPSNIVRLPPEHAHYAAEILSLAFQADPLITYLIPDEEKRISHAYQFYRVLVANGLRTGEVYGIIAQQSQQTSNESFQLNNLNIPNGLNATKEMTNPYAAISVWYHGGNSLAVLDMIRSGVLRYFKYRFFYRMIPLMGTLQRTEKIHHERVPFDHYYLSLLGAHPNYKGRKYTATLLRALFAEFDRNNLPSYLETNKESNVPVYQHFGYKIIGETEVRKAGIHIWSMLRSAETLQKGES